MTDTQTHAELRYAHFHQGATATDPATGATRPIKGRLVATVATTDLGDGTIAVGVSRCHVGDNPVRFIGRHKSKARLDRLVAAIRQQDLKPTQTELLEKERAELLAFRMSRETFVEKVVRGQLIRNLALATDPAEIRKLTTELRAATL